MAARGLFAAWLGDGEGPCALASASLEPRTSLAPSALDRHAFAVVRRGTVLRERVDADGQRSTVDVVGPGGLVPLHASTDRDRASVRASSRVVLCLYREPVLDENVDRVTLSDLLALTQETVDRLESIAAARALSSAAAKVRALLEALARAFPSRVDGRGVALGLAQRDIADLLHLRAETVCRSMRRLEAAE